VLKKFEQPADTGEAVCAGRAARGQAFYDTYVATGENEEGQVSNMTEKELRQKVVDTAVAWIGCKESDGSHKKIIDVYNSHKPLARGYAVQYTDAWCATFVSAVAVKLGITSIMPTECGCGEMIKLYQNLGRWKEDDSYVPSIGDIIMYDWDDSGKGDCTGEPEHVGIVIKVSSNNIKVIEGNKNDAVGYRTITVNGRYIRGYCLPDYASVTSADTSINTTTNTTSQEQTSGTKLNTEPKWVGASKVNGLNVRSYAGTEYPNIKSYPNLDKGNLVDVCDTIKDTKGNKWYYIRIAGKIYGFVRSKYIKKQ
jgi:hypothetical protein